MTDTMYIELNRSFSLVTKEGEEDFLQRREWGDYFGKNLDWNKLLKYQRVVLLAEASCGKTAEFEQQVRQLNQTGQNAFFMRVEDLADDGFEENLGADISQKFSDWKKSSDIGYFFLDSVDEARLNRKRFDKALLKFSKEMAGNLARAHIFISCRVSDWKFAADRSDIMNILPCSPPKEEEKPSPTPESGEDSLLLDRIFKKEEEDEENNRKQDEKYQQLLVVQLLELKQEQWRTFADGSFVADIENFLTQITLNGLEPLAESPGDLADLIAYWKKNSCFSARREMIDFGISQKIQERQSDRADNAVLSEQKARQGAQAIAAALTLGKTFTLLAPQENSFSASQDDAKGLNVKDILRDWNDAQRTTLLRRKIFAPATYGRIRFHHRSTQEFLTAQWFDTLLEKGCTKTVIFDLFFPKIYGVKSVVTSLRPIIAWLALKHQDICAELVAREPFVLLDFGDPKSLPLETKKTLLQNYAKKYKEGYYKTEYATNTQLWMFADQGLATTIREIWIADDKDYYFTSHLLTLIKEAKITDCLDLVQQVALAPTSEENLRFQTVATLKALGDDKTIKKLACYILKPEHDVTGAMATYFARDLFPEFITVSELLTLIERSAVDRESLRIYKDDLVKLWEDCPEDKKQELLQGLIELCTTKPFLSEYLLISRKYKHLVKGMEPIVCLLLKKHPDSVPNAVLSPLLNIIRYKEHYGSTEDHQADIKALVQQKPAMNHALFWKDVEEERIRKTKYPIINWRAARSFCYSNFWDIEKITPSAFINDLENLEHPDNRRVGLSALNLLINFQDVDEKHSGVVKEIEGIISGVAILEQDLEDYRTPPKEEDYERDSREFQEEVRYRQAEEEAENKESWKIFKEELCSDRSSWGKDEHSKGFRNRLDNLTKWLRRRINADEYMESASHKAVLQWQLLEEGFDAHTAQNYHDGMKRLWRTATPERPTHEGNSTSTAWTTVFSVLGIQLEAVQEGWVKSLSEEEAALAGQHLCRCEEGYSIELDALLEAYPKQVLPIIEDELIYGWRSDYEFHSNLWSAVRFPEKEVNAKLIPKLVEIIANERPAVTRQLEYGVKTISHLKLNKTQRSQIEGQTLNHLDAAIKQEKTDFIHLYLALLFQVNIAQAISSLEQFLDAAEEDKKKQRAESCFAALFKHHNRLVFGGLSDATTAQLKGLVLLVYQHIKPEEDIERRSGAYTPNLRDNAESGRGYLLGFLFEKEGEAAYRAVLDLKNETSLTKNNKDWLIEQAHKMVTRDSEISIWSAEQTTNFATTHQMPITSGEKFYQLVLAQLGNISHDFQHQDASSQALLQGARNEAEVQGWLTEQLRLRAKGRYHTHREAEVHNNKKPDIVISSTRATYEVAIEIKRDTWTVKQLDQALETQLVGQYLKPAHRKHGVLVITHHNKKFWVNPETKKQMSFAQVIDRLKRRAEVITQDRQNDFTVSVIGIEIVVA